MSLSYETQFERELKLLLEDAIASNVESVTTVGSSAATDFNAYQRCLGAIHALRGVRDTLCDEANKRLRER